ncbi:DUF4112 domain-containing protein [Hirschia litorea]|uniref:DUF4112 domain-containing protein n=1 Tax=Hirschia litorea TaxID=1199156 RepID=A0ABW2IJ88_9PROT
MSQTPNSPLEAEVAQEEGALEITSAQSSKLKDMEALARLLDSRFTIPGLNVKYGIDGLIGLIPGIGDVLTALLGFYIIARSVVLGGSFFLIVRMLFNLLIDVTLGAIPLVGDFFDFAFRSNANNVKMLIKHMDKQNRKAEAKAQKAALKAQSRA